MRSSIAIITLTLLVPLAAADDARPGVEDADAENGDRHHFQLADVVRPDMGTVVVVVGAPGSPPIIVAPGSASAPMSAPPVVDDDPCGVHRSGHWRQRMQGRVSIGFSRSHLELEDDAEGTQKSFVARLNGRRGWAIEFELSKMTLDGGDHAKTAGASIVKAFGRRRVAPYLLAGGGGGRYETPAGEELKMRFGEAGAGVMLRGRRFSVGVDMRRGVREIEEGAMDVMRAVVAEDEEDGRERYTRGRVVALINF